MARETKTSLRNPEVDVLETIRIDRLGLSIEQTYYPCYKVYEADGVTQSVNAFGQPLYERANMSPYTFRITNPTKMMEVESNTLARVVAAVLEAQAAGATDVTSIVQHMLVNGKGIDNAMTEESEALHAALFSRADDLMQNEEYSDDFIFETLQDEFMVELPADFMTLLYANVSVPNE